VKKILNPKNNPSIIQNLLHKGSASRLPAVKLAVVFLLECSRW
jgi:hypothetical protein